MTDEKLLEMYVSTLLIRAFDSRLPDLYTKGLVPGSSHAATAIERMTRGRLWRPATALPVTFRVTRSGRTRDEVAEWTKRDPLVRIRGRLVAAALQRVVASTFEAIWKPAAS